MESVLGKTSKVRHPSDDGSPKFSVTCSNVPMSLLDPSTARSHFGKFGRISKILLQPKKQACILEYCTREAASKAVLNAGAYDGYQFDVVTTKRKKKKLPKKEDDPEWLPDSDVESELTAMGNVILPRTPRQKTMELDVGSNLKPQYKSIAAKHTRITDERANRKHGLPAGYWPPPLTPAQSLEKTIPLPAHRPPIASGNKIEARKKTFVATAKMTTAADSAALASVAMLSTAEAAAELAALRQKQAATVDDKRRILEARDRILRAWGGTGPRVQGATAGTCPDMCPEKERLAREAEHQVTSFEQSEGGGHMDHRLAVKQYSRSSADQEAPMCHELRPAKILRRTTEYLLRELADLCDDPYVSEADWFHFMWDRLRGVRKDITQQALCCTDSVRLVEQCARFHAHCAARLADLDEASFSQRLNSDNLAKSLQTLKHMYSDLAAHGDKQATARESEFRGYVALLNLGDANFMWEVQQLSPQIQQSPEIRFAMKVFSALDSNNFVSFFRLVRQASYLQACILLRYFNDVRARALARIVKAYSPRGASRYPAFDIMKILGFEDLESLNQFVTHYGLRFNKADSEDISVILDRNIFTDDSEPYRVSRAVMLIESKRNVSVGEIIYGEPLPVKSSKDNVPHNSFDQSDFIKESSLTAEDQGYTPNGNANKCLDQLRKALYDFAANKVFKMPIQPITVSRSSESGESQSQMKSDLSNPFLKSAAPDPQHFSKQGAFSFKSAIMVSDSPSKNIPARTDIFSFSEPKVSANLWTSVSQTDGETKEDPDGNNLFKKPQMSSNIFAKPNNAHNHLSTTSSKNNNIFLSSLDNVSQNSSDTAKNIFSILGNKSNQTNIFTSAATVKATSENIFTKPVVPAKNVFDSSKSQANIFIRSTDTGNLFGQNEKNADVFIKPNFNDKNESYKSQSQNIFSNAFAASENSKTPNIFANQNSTPILFKPPPINIEEDELNRQAEALIREQKRLEAERSLREKKIIEEERLEEERKRKEVAKKIEEEKRAAELKRIAEEKEKAIIEKKKREEEKLKAERKRKLLEDIEEESTNITQELICEVNDEIVEDFLSDEVDKMNELVNYSSKEFNSIMATLIHEILTNEITTILYYRKNLAVKWIAMWKKIVVRNMYRRKAIFGTPVWLPDMSTDDKSSVLKRKSLPETLDNMNAFHRGYHFSGNLPPNPITITFKMADIIGNSIVKSLKKHQFRPSEKIYWKVALSLPECGKTRTLLDMNRWIDLTFNKKNNNKDEEVLYLSQEKWKHQIDIALSVTRYQNSKNIDETKVFAGSNAIIIFSTGQDMDLGQRIEANVACLRKFQVIPVVLIIPKLTLECLLVVENILKHKVKNNVISDYQIYTMEQKYDEETLRVNSVAALKWLAKRMPPKPPLEMNTLRCFLHQCIGNELWYRLRLELNTSIGDTFKDVERIIRIYNSAIDRSKDLLLDSTLNKFPKFPDELKIFLHECSYPKSYEYFPPNITSKENIKKAVEIINTLYFPCISSHDIVNVRSVRENVYFLCQCSQWYKDPESMSMQIIANIPVHEDSEIFFTSELLNIFDYLVGAKINQLLPTDGNQINVAYRKHALTSHRSEHWWYSMNDTSSVKIKPIEYEPDVLDETLQFHMNSEPSPKRKKIDDFNESDIKKVEDKIQSLETTLTANVNLNKTLQELDKKLDAETIRFKQFEETLRLALMDN